MIILGAALIGVLMGLWTAKRRGGKTLDLLHYAAGYAIAFALIGLIATVIIGRAVL